jgi:predicted RNA-binding Zn-ribbon protein involved in translation (DUF1610 family)
MVLLPHTLGGLQRSHKITGRDLIIQLLECCDEDLRKDLTRSNGGSLTNQTEEDVLTSVKKLAVREENIMVARVALNDMRQDHTETICSFGARIRVQATICKFLFPCPNCNTEVNYTDQILRDILVRGIADNDIQLDILGEANQDMPLEEIFRYIEAKEAGKRSASKLSSGLNSSRSQYRKTKHESIKNKGNTVKNPICNYCGKSGHGQSSPLDTKKGNAPPSTRNAAFATASITLKMYVDSKKRPQTTREPSLIPSVLSPPK